MQKKTVLVFVPHPDDAEFYAGGTICKMADEGYRVVLVTASDGGKASFRTSTPELVIQRKAEAERGAAVIGVSELVMLGYSDFELDQLPVGLLREQYIRLVRIHRPEIVFAQDAMAGNEFHPDHKAVAAAAAEAVAFSHLPLVYPQHLVEGLAPHFVVEKYFFSDDQAVANRVVDISATFDRKIAALAEHQSQVKFLVEELMMQAGLAGLNVTELLGEAASNPLATLRWGLEAKAVEIGKKTGCLYGEAFRYSRFHPMIEGVLQIQNSAPEGGNR
jgi:LmbE family N-acetylglucosaminyl deacetylase